jgi:hypothetical protein
MGLRCTSKPAWKPPTDRHQPLGSEEPRGLTPARTRPPRRRLTTSGRRPMSEDLDLELPTRSGAPKSTFDRTTRDRATPPEEPLPPDDSAPHPEGYHTAPPWAPPDSSRDPSSDPSTPPRSEDHRGASSNPTVRRRPRPLASLPPSPRTPPQHRPRHADPKDGEARKANALRPCGPISWSMGRPATPKDHRTRARRPPLSPRSSSLPLTGLARPLRRDVSRCRCPTPSSAGTRSRRQRVAVELRRALGRRLPSPPRPLRPACTPGRCLPTPKGRIARPGGHLAAEIAVAERAGHLGAPKNPSAGRRTV